MTTTQHSPGILPNMCWTKWGTGRIVHHENLFELVRGLKEKLGDPEADVERSALCWNRS